MADPCLRRLSGRLSASPGNSGDDIFDDVDVSGEWPEFDHVDDEDTGETNVACWCCSTSYDVTSGWCPECGAYA